MTYPPPRLELARKLGARHVINGANEDAVREVRKLCAEEGAEVCIEAAGVPATVKQCFAAVRIAGTVIFNGEQSAVSLSPSDDFIRRDITAVGSWFYQVKEFPAMLQLYREGLRVQEMITHSFPLTEAAAAYRVFAAGESGKVMLQM